jgi:hypothetical protein
MRDFAVLQTVRGRWIATAGLFAALGAIAVAVALTGLAGAKTPRRAATSDYGLSLKIISGRFVGSGSENPIAVDRHGNVYVFRATRMQQGSIPSPVAADVVELSPAGHKIRSFPTTFHLHGQAVYITVNGVAVTPNGRDVLVVGNFSETPGLVDSKPFLAKYSASTGRFVKGYNFDGDGNRLGQGIAVDPSGTHVYVGDQRNPFIGHPNARIYEFDVAHLHKVRSFRLAGNDVCCDLAVASGGHVFAQIGPPHSTKVLIQEYGPHGGLENQFTSPPTGLAISSRGDIFAGSRAKHRIDRLSSKGKVLGTLGTGHFPGLPVPGAVDASGDVYAFDVAQNEVATLLKFAPLVPQTSITAHPSSTVQIPTATFRFKSSVPGATLQCRLRNTGAKSPAFKPCSGPKTYDDLANGTYRFQARSISPVGPVERTPAAFRFAVKLLHPDTVITSQPASTIGASTATFAFKSSISGASFACRIERVGSPSPAFKSCTSPATYGQLSNGEWTFEVQASTSHGVADPTPAHGTFTVDTTPPTVTGPSPPTIPVGGQLEPDGTLGVQESWSATDTYSPASELLYTVEQRSGASPETLGLFAATPGLENMQGTTSAVVPIAPSGLYHELRIRAENQLGVAADSPAGDPFQLSVIDSSDARITYATGWSKTSDSAAYGGTLSTTSTSGAAATLTFSGESIAIVAPLRSNYGSIRVCLDPLGTTGAGCSVMTLHSTTSQDRDVVYVSGPLGAGQHSLAISDTNGKSVALDAVVVLG